MPSGEHSFGYGTDKVPMFLTLAIISSVATNIQMSLGSLTTSSCILPEKDLRMLRFFT